MNSADQSGPTGREKPRLAFMGEFSSGKSTLSKLLLGDAPLPVRVTATRFPPVWISHGEPRAIAVGKDGVETPLPIDELPSVRIEDTQLIRLYATSDTLEICDLIDMPGISDPSMSSDSWQSVVNEIDCVVWCTQATQAWRQSEAAAWQDMQPRTNGDNILLVTQIDKLRSDRDVERVLTRVRKETQGLFKAVYPLSILKAIEAGDDIAKWTESGAADFVDHLIDLLLRPSPRPETPVESAGGEPAPADAIAVEIAPAAPQIVQGTQAQSVEAGQDRSEVQVTGEVVDMASRVRPKRVRALTEMRGRVSRPGFAPAGDRQDPS